MDCKSLKLGSNTSLLIKIGTITINTFFLPTWNKFIAVALKSILWDSLNSWKAFSSFCWLWKHFPCKKLQRCLKKWWSVGERSGEYSRWYTVQFSSVTQLCPILCDPMNCSTPGLPVLHKLPEFTQTHVHWVGVPSSHLIFCRPLLLLPPIPPSIRVFSNESTLCMRWPKYWSFSFSIIPSKNKAGKVKTQLRHKIRPTD